MSGKNTVLSHSNEGEGCKGRLWRHRCAPPVLFDHSYSQERLIRPWRAELGRVVEAKGLIKASSREDLEINSLKYSVGA